MNKSLKRLIQLIILLSMTLNKDTFAQDYARYNFLVGVEDTLGVTHLFSHLRESYIGECSYLTEDGLVTVSDRFNREDIRHINTQSNIDSLFIASGSGLWLSENGTSCDKYGKYIVDFEIIDNDFSKYLLNERRLDNGKRFIKASNGSSIENLDGYFYVLANHHERVVYVIDFYGSYPVKYDTLFENKVQIQISELTTSTDYDLLQINPYKSNHYVMTEVFDSIPIYSSTDRGNSVSVYHYEFLRSSPEFQLDERNVFSSDSTTFYLLDEGSLQLHRISVDETGYTSVFQGSSYFQYALDPSEPSHLYVVQDDSILFSDDFGDSFEAYYVAPDIIRGFYKKPGSDISYFQTDQVIYKLEDGELNSIRDLSVSNENDDISIVDVYKLHQNYPNPFNPSTNISFTLSQANEVSLKVFNLLGQEVANLINERKSAGTHTVNFDASGLSSGVYIYQLISGDAIQTKKMLLIK